MKRIVPESFRKLYEKTQKGKASPRAVIKMMCAECVQYIRDEVTKCSDFGCPAHRYRPFQDKPNKNVNLEPKISDTASFGDAK
jgi:hypothetical protein